ncbi:MAG: Rrf2 family transcriptional regulator [Candidatus Aureabacteria bacterium]|nr:Rrf2 family transcriptional regulator [Candidatus Auribacterota bacterium]
MRLSTRSRYGLRLMCDLASCYGKGPVLLKDIARREDISEKYLSNIVIPLRGCGMVISTRGAHGGYALAKAPDSIKIRDIIEILEGDLCLVECVKNSGACKRSSFCLSRDIWMDIKKKIYDVLDSVTLKDLVNKDGRKKGKSK